MQRFLRWCNAQRTGQELIKQRRNVAVTLLHKLRVSNTRGKLAFRRGSRQLSTRLLNFDLGFLLLQFLLQTSNLFLQRLYALRSKRRSRFFEQLVEQRLFLFDLIQLLIALSKFRCCLLRLPNQFFFATLNLFSHLGLRRCSYALQRSTLTVKFFTQGFDALALICNDVAQSLRGNGSQVFFTKQQGLFCDSLQRPDFFQRRANVFTKLSLFTQLLFQLGQLLRLVDGFLHIDRLVLCYRLLRVFNTCKGLANLICSVVELLKLPILLGLFIWLLGKRFDLRLVVFKVALCQSFGISQH